MCEDLLCAKTRLREAIAGRSPHLACLPPCLPARYLPAYLRASSIYLPVCRTTALASFLLAYIFAFLPTSFICLLYAISSPFLLVYLFFFSLYLLACLFLCLRACLFDFLLPFLPFYLFPLPVYLPGSLPHWLLPYLPVHLLSCLPSCFSTCLYVYLLLSFCVPACLSFCLVVCVVTLSLPSSLPASFLYSPPYMYVFLFFSLIPCFFICLSLVCLLIYLYGWFFPPYPTPHLPVSLLAYSPICLFIYVYLRLPVCLYDRTLSTIQPAYRLLLFVFFPMITSPSVCLAMFPSVYICLHHIKFLVSSLTMCSPLCLPSSSLPHVFFPFSLPTHPPFILL